jgi:hypothetical protein
MKQYIHNDRRNHRKTRRWAWVALGILAFSGILIEIVDIVAIRSNIDFEGVVWSRFHENRFIISETVFWTWIVVVMLMRWSRIYSIRFRNVLWFCVFIASDVLTYFVSMRLLLMVLFVAKLLACIFMVPRGTKGVDFRTNGGRDTVVR